MILSTEAKLNQEMYSKMMPNCALIPFDTKPVKYKNVRNLEEKIVFQYFPGKSN